jgi:hypothetical protein
MKVCFNHCIWLVSDKETDWECESKGFKTHVTIKMNLSYINAFLTLLMLKEQDYILEIDSDIIEDNENYFKALYYKVKFSDENKIPKPYWWPINSHISVAYKYGNNFTTEEKKKFFLKSKKVIFNKFILMNCNGHHLEWKNIN